jgi:transposase
LYFHSQDRAIISDDVVAFLEHLQREVSGRMVIIWDGAPIHRSHAIQEFLAHGAAQRLHLERLPAYAPELLRFAIAWRASTSSTDAHEALCH